MSPERILRAAPRRAGGGVPPVGPSSGPRRVPDAPLRASRGTPATPASLVELATPAERHHVAHETGWEAGYEAGRQVAERELAARLDEAAALVERRRHQLTGLVATLDGVVHELEAATAARSQEICAGIADAACELAEAVLGRELRSEPRAALDAVARGLSAAPDGPVTVLVHPDDLAAVRDAWAGGSRLRFEADPGIAPGGCVLQAGAATIDATVDGALRRARAALRGDPS